MSGGSHDYAYLKLENIADSFWVEPKPIEQEMARKKVAIILKYISKVCHDIEWIDSGDYGEEDWKKVIENLSRIEIKK